MLPKWNQIATTRLPNGECQVLLVIWNSLHFSKCYNAGALCWAQQPNHPFTAHHSTIFQWYSFVPKSFVLFNHAFAHTLIRSFIMKCVGVEVFTLSSSIMKDWCCCCSKDECKSVNVRGSLHKNNNNTNTNTFIYCIHSLWCDGDSDDIGGSGNMVHLAQARNCKNEI